jgi:hypothetical protein
MKSTLAALTILAAGSVASAQNITHQNVNSNVVTKVATALNHISLIEMPEPITNAAVGSVDVRIEWHGNMVAIKPLRQNQPTNLFIWTEHTQSTYEIQAAGEVTSASFLIDETGTPASWEKHLEKAQPTQEEIQKTADALIDETLLLASPVGSRGLKDAKDHVNVRIEEVVREKDTLYVRYTVSNPSRHQYRISAPSVFSVIPNDGGESVASLRDTQVSDQWLAAFPGSSTSQISLRETSVSIHDIAPGQSAQGVLCFARPQSAPQIYQFVFANDENHPIHVTAVL